MATVRTVPLYNSEEHYIVNRNHHMIRCAHNRGHWWYYDDHIHGHVPARELTMDDFGTLVPVSKH